MLTQTHIHAHTCPPNPLHPFSRRWGEYWEDVPHTRTVVEAVTMSVYELAPAEITRVFINMVRVNRGRGGLCWRCWTCIECPCPHHLPPLCGDGPWGGRSGSASSNPVCGACLAPVQGRSARVHPLDPPPSSPALPLKAQGSILPHACLAWEFPVLPCSCSRAWLLR